jgi:hypothetical protein
MKDVIANEAKQSRLGGNELENQPTRLFRFVRNDIQAEG